MYTYIYIHTQADVNKCHSHRCDMKINSMQDQQAKKPAPNQLSVAQKYM